MKKAIYTNFTPYFFHTALLLKEHNICEPVYWLVGDKIKDQVEKEFPNCETHKFFEAIKGFMPIKNKYDLNGLLDEPILKHHAITESICLNMMNRNDITLTYTYYERISMYKHYLRMSIAILDQHQPNIVFFTEEPHQAFNYVLYKESLRRGIKTQMFSRTSFPQRMINLWQFEKGNREVIDLQNNPNLKEASFIELPEDIRMNLERMKGDYKIGMPKFMKWQYEAFSKKKFRFIKTISKTIGKIERNINPFKFYKSFRNLYKETLTDQNHPKKGFFNTTVSSLELSNWINKTKNKNKELLKYYNKICKTNIDLNQNFVLFTLHYQPEKSTSPIGEYYVDQLLAIELISKKLPKNWKLFVKEHISQFVVTRYGNQTRSIAFYEAIQSCPNTELISLNLNSFDLIDKANATASVTGTVVFEGIVRGKPGMHFGNSWYRGCYGTKYVKSGKDVEEFFTEFKDFQYNEEKFFAFLKQFSSLSYKGTVGDKQTDKQNISQEQNGIYHFDALKDILNTQTYF